MAKEFSRTELLLGKEAMDILKGASVAVFGIGGVGSFAAEALARCGIEHITLVDDDDVCLSNLNRQLVALHSTIGRKKAEVMSERILDINPSCEVTAKVCFYTADNADTFDLSAYDYIIDAIDTVSSKLVLIERAKASDTPIISSMGAGNKLDPTRFEIADIKKTSVCPLAKVMRRELKTRGITSLKVVYSKEMPIKPTSPKQENKVFDASSDFSNLEPNLHAKRQTPGSISFVPSAAGLIIASEVVKDLIKIFHEHSD